MAKIGTIHTSSRVLGVGRLTEQDRKLLRRGRRGNSVMKALRVDNWEDVATLSISQLKRTPGCGEHTLAGIIWWVRECGGFELPNEPQIVSGRLNLGYMNTAALNRFEPSQLAALTNLSLKGAQLKNLRPLIVCHNLQQLDLEGAKGAEDLRPLAACHNLQRLYLGDTQTTDWWPLAACQYLERLYAGHNPVEDLLPLSACRGLQILELDHTDVQDLTPLAALSGLDWLKLDYARRLKDVSPLAACRNMRVLILSDTDVDEVSPLAELFRLVTLDIQHARRLQDVSSLRGLNKLRRLELWGTGVRDVSMLAHLADLKITLPHEMEQSA